MENKKCINIVMVGSVDVIETETVVDGKEIVGKSERSQEGHSLRAVRGLEGTDCLDSLAKTKYSYV